MRPTEILVKQFTMHTRWYTAALEGVSEEEALVRHYGEGNHLRWLAGHLMLIRYNNAVRIGMPAEEIPYVDLYVVKNAPPPAVRGLDPSFDYPPLSDIIPRWNRYSEFMINAVSRMSDVMYDGS